LETSLKKNREFFIDPWTDNPLREKLLLETSGIPPEHKMNLS
jgi:hypothetical protein